MPILVAPRTGTGTRYLGSIALDDSVNAFIHKESVTYNFVRDLQLERMVNRYGRMARINEDRKPLEASIKGLWIDGGGNYFRNWKAALESQKQQPFDTGDGTVLYACDLVDLIETRVAGGNPGSGNPLNVWGWTMKLASYEAYAREKAVGLDTVFGSMSLSPITGANTSGSYSYGSRIGATANGEPTWQFTIVMGASVALNTVILTNNSTNESITVVVNYTNNTGAAQTVYLIIDSCGSIVAAAGGNPTPNNNGYGLLAFPSSGYGATLLSSTGAKLAPDLDFSGLPPTLAASATSAMGGAATSNSLTATLVSNAALTSASLAVLAPARFVR